jgi:hypothetical protein
VPSQPLAFFRFPEDLIQREAACTFVDRLKDQDMKQHLLMGGERSLSEAHNQALKLEVAEKPIAKLWEVRAGVPMRTWLTVAECLWTGQPVYAGSVEMSVTSEQTVDRDMTGRPVK